MKTQLIELAQDNDQESRSTLVVALADLFMAGEQQDMTAAKDLFGEVVMMVIDDASQDDRRRLADRIAESELSPHDLVSYLAGDVVEVAEPVLSGSPVLSQADLVRLAGSQSAEHLMAIAERQGIDAAVTDILVQRGNLEVARKVTKNKSAQFSKDSLGMLVARARKDAELQENLVFRDDLPKDVTEKLIPFLTKELRAKLTQSLTGGGQKTEASASTANVGLHNMQAEIDDMIAKIKGGEESQDSLIGKYAAQDDLDNVAYIIAELSGVPGLVVGRSLQREEPMPVMLLCRSIDLSVPCFTAICQARAKQLNLTIPKVQSAIRQYQTIPVEKARRTVKSGKIE